MKILFSLNSSLLQQWKRFVSIATSRESLHSFLIQVFTIWWFWRAWPEYRNIEGRSRRQCCKGATAATVPYASHITKSRKSMARILSFRHICLVPWRCKYIQLPYLHSGFNDIFTHYKYICALVASDITSCNQFTVCVIFQRTIGKVDNRWTNWWLEKKETRSI